MRLILASPTYGPTEPQSNIAIRVAIMHAARNGHEWLGDASPNREAWEAARNNVVQSVIDEVTEYPDDTRIFWCDSDIVLPNHAITTLADTGFDFVTGIYFQRRKPHMPLVATFNGDRFHFVAQWPDNIIAPIDGCGFGCVLTSLGMLRKMPAPWFKFEKYSEDFDFCIKAQKAGYQLYMHTGVLCGHLQDPKPATIADFERENSHLLGGQHGGSSIGLNRRDGQTGNVAVLGD